MTTKLYKAADVCEMTQVQAYVLRSWEKEFPGIGIQKSQDSPRLYRQSDVEQVLRIRQLVFGEGLTLAGARRRLEEEAPSDRGVSDDEVAEVIEALGAHARERITVVRDGLRSILELLAVEPRNRPAGPAAAVRASSGNGGVKASKSPAAKVRTLPARVSASRASASASRTKTPASRPKPTAKKAAKRKRAGA